MARAERRAYRHRILGTRELRERLPEILRDFRENGAKADLLIGGANRHPEVVLLSYESYLDLMDELDNLSIQSLYAERVEGARRSRTEHSRTPPLSSASILTSSLHRGSAA